jgi:hypothetical protein
MHILIIVLLFLLIVFVMKAGVQKGYLNGNELTSFFGVFKRLYYFIAISIVLGCVIFIFTSKDDNEQIYALITAIVTLPCAIIMHLLVKWIFFGGFIGISKNTFITILVIMIGASGMQIYKTSEYNKTERLALLKAERAEQAEFAARLDRDQKAKEAEERKYALDLERQKNMDIVNSANNTRHWETIQMAENEIVKTQGYNAVFRVRLVEANNNGDQIYANRIISAMAQNEQWIRQQQSIIDNLQQK